MISATLTRDVPAAQQLVLLVEDDADDVLLVKRAFRKANLASPMQVVTDGDQAVDYLSGQGAYQDRNRWPMPMLVLLDYKLPRRSGLEVLRWVRSKAELTGLPVVVLTSSKEASDVVAAYAAGANSYLLKPVDFDDLLAMIKALDLYWLTLNKSPIRP